jgi:hypothetical protein
VKTISLKKVSAVAVAAISLSGLSAISATPAFALADETANLTVFATSPTTATALSGTASIDIYVGANAALTAAAGFTVLPTNTSRPNGASAPTLSLTSSGAAAPFATSGTAANTSTLTTSGVGLQSTANGTSGGTLATISGGVGTKIGVLTVTGFDQPGIYRVTVTPDGAGTDTAVVLNIPVGYSADAVNANRVFPYQGSNTTTGWSGTSSGLAGLRITNLTAATRYYVTVDKGAINSVAVTASIAGGVASGGTASTFNNTNGTNLSGGIDFWSTSATRASLTSDGVDITVTDLGAASTTVKVVTYSASTGAATTFATATVTWGVAPAISTTYSTATLAAGNACSTAATTPIVLASTAGVTLAAGTTTGASLCIQTKDQYDVALTGQALSVTISGPGLIRLDDNTTTGVTGNVRTQSLTAASRASTSTAAIGITADGTAGVATITVTSGTTVIATKTVTFYGAVAKYTPTVLQVVSADGVATTDAVLVAATDAAGVVVPGATIYAFSGNTAAASVPSSVTTVTSAGTLGGTAPASFQAATPIGSAEVNVTGVSATTEKEVTLTFGNASTLALSTVKATAVVKIGSIKASSIKVTTDKTSYAPGEAMKITFSMTDSLGRPIAGGAGTGLLDSVITSASLSGDTLPTTAIASLTGSKTYTVFAPLSGGKLKITTTTGAAGTFVATAAADQVIVTDVTVTDPNASLLTQIDALNAKIVALNALIAKIMNKLVVN